MGLSQALRTTDFGIFSLTPTNLTNPWHLFEAGAISKKLDSPTCTISLGDLRDYLRLGCGTEPTTCPCINRGMVSLRPACRGR